MSTMAHDEQTEGNVHRYRGEAAAYDRYRPQPPDELVPVLCRFAQVSRPEAVVDQGCGTGLSTRIWSNKAHRVVGVEPNADYLHFARDSTSDPAIEFHC